MIYPQKSNIYGENINSTSKIMINIDYNQSIFGEFSIFVHREMIPMDNLISPKSWTSDCGCSNVSCFCPKPFNEILSEDDQ